MKKEELKKLIKPYENDSMHPYYRPYVIRKEQKKYNVFLVGVNPATPIYENEINLDEYVDLLMDYDAFYQEYNRIREKTGKTKISRTRLGINNFVDEIEVLTDATILETNVVPYPTKNIKELKNINPKVIDYALDLFYKVLMRHSPEVIIVYSKTSLKYLMSVLRKNDIIEDHPPLNQPIKDIENSKGAFLEFTYENSDKRGMIFVCRHFMYYGKKGNSFEGFKNKVTCYLNRDK